MPTKYVVTNPIYYPNSVPHVGTALTSVVTDAFARYHRMLGEETFFITGTDENGLKLKEAAEAAGRDPKEFIDDISGKFREVWSEMNIRPDDFIRTSEKRHFDAVQELFRQLQANGFIYKGTYEGWYDVSSETFYKDSDIVDGKSPDGNPVRRVTEDNYFFKLSAFSDQLLKHIEANPDFLIPVARKNEVISFIQQGLRDVCISRINPGRGIPVPGDPDRVIWVWFDAVISYLSPSGWPGNHPDGSPFTDRWPASAHWMAKDIFTRFHATLWPAMLLGVGLPLPDHIVGHAYLLFGGEKISKSKGNVVAPLELATELSQLSGAAPDLAMDAVRYILAAMTPFESDSLFSIEGVHAKYNSDLANDLGNALNRSLAMTQKFSGGIIPDSEPEPEVLELIAKQNELFQNSMSEYRIDKAVTHAMDVVRFLNKYIDTRAPWNLSKTNDPALGSVLRGMLLCLRSAEGLLRPFMPSTSDAIAKQLGLPPLTLFSAIGTIESLPGGTRVETPSPMFPRLDLSADKTAQEAAASEKKAQKLNSEKPKMTENPTPTPEITAPEITIEDFMKVKLRVARIVEAEPLEGSDKLMKLQLMIGDEKRQIVAGIRKNYSSEDLIGRQIIVVANLKPAKLRGVESQGMLLAATDEDGSAVLLMPDREVMEGAGVK